MRGEPNETTGDTAPARIALPLVVLVLAVPASSHAAEAARAAPAVDGAPWWLWPLLLFAVTFAMGILAPLAGVGGGVLFGPIVSGFFPFHLDFVRATGLLIALAGALAAGPGLLRANLASLRLAMPVALVASVSSVVGALLGLALPTDVVQICLGLTILLICGVMLAARRAECPDVQGADRLADALRICGAYREQSSGQEVAWRVHRTTTGLCLFVVIGIAAGMFGMGAGWANVPVLNLVMGAPLKTSVATSSFLLSITDTSAAWIYVNRGCVIPVLVVPSMVGIMLGARLGVRLLKIARPAAIRWVVIGVLALAGLRALAKGFGI